jgi:hypothetical protein
MKYDFCTNMFNIPVPYAVPIADNVAYPIGASLRENQRHGFSSEQHRHVHTLLKTFLGCTCGPIG